VKGTSAAAEANTSHRRDPLLLLVPGTAAEPEPGRNDRQSELLRGVVGENRLWPAGLGRVDVEDDEELGL
jgi:hypothetical protein